MDVKVPAGLADPAVAVSVILPWETRWSDGLTVGDLLRNELADKDGEVDEDLDVLLKFASAYLPEEPPSSWEFGVEPETLEIEPGSSATTTLRVAVGEPKGVAFAVQAVDVERSDKRGVSDVVVLDCDEDGTSSILYAD